MIVREPSAPSSDDSAVNWPEAPAYSYSGFADLRNVGVAMLLTLVPFFLALAGLNAFWGVGSNSYVWSIGYAVFGAVSAFIGVAFMRDFAFDRPEIALSADGVFAYRRGKPWRFIGWRGVVSITRCTPASRGARLFLLIKGPRHTIKVYESIDRFADLSECLSRYARDHGLLRRPWGDWLSAAAVGLDRLEIAEP
jgi:hypothetical protein